ncbi:hypothetical protein BY996DRAFT_4572474, partial [Phakopsora pachyrhizi]
PFIPQSYRFGNENSLVEPSMFRRRESILKSQARVIPSKQAFKWRLMRLIFRIENQSDVDGNRSKEFQTMSRNSFYDETLLLEDYWKIDSDPVPRVIKIFGDWDRLT